MNKGEGFFNTNLKSGKVGGNFYRGAGKNVDKTIDKQFDLTFNDCMKCT